VTSSRDSEFDVNLGERVSSFTGLKEKKRLIDFGTKDRSRVEGDGSTVDLDVAAAGLKRWMYWIRITSATT
jgi:hypothetical protein